MLFPYRLHVYEWAKLLITIDMPKLAIYCFDLTAMNAPTMHLQLNSRISASQLRTGINFSWILQKKHCDQLSLNIPIVYM